MSSSHWLLVDTPMVLGIWTCNAVYIADLIVIPIEVGKGARERVPPHLGVCRVIVCTFRPGVHLESLCCLVMSEVDSAVS